MDRVTITENAVVWGPEYEGKVTSGLVTYLVMGWPSLPLSGALKTEAKSAAGSVTFVVGLPKGGPL